MDYPFESIQINNREVLIEEIRAEKVTALSAFEVSTFTILRKWFQGIEEFPLQTSGSTGPPKKILLKRYQMEASARSTIHALRLKRGDVSLTCLDTQFIAGQMMIVRSLIGGMRIIAVEPSANPLRQLSDSRISFTALVPYQLKIILDSLERKRLSRIPTVIVGGAPISAEILPQLEALNSRVFLTYGMTETVSHIALRPLNGPEKSDVFHTLPGISINTDLRGCLQVTAAFLEQSLVTNDLVELINAASFRWLGRIDNVINTGGVKVSPEVIESRLDSFKLSLNLHDRFVISSLPDPLLGEKLVCVIERKGLDSGVEKSLFGFFLEKLGRFERPRDIFCIYPFPETASGKIDRKAIKKLVNRQP